MAGPKLTAGEREKLLEMLADGVPRPEIAREFDVSLQNVKYHASANLERIRELASERSDLALSTGLALRGNRKERLERMASALEREFGPDFTGAKAEKLQVVREWRETLSQIRQEMKDIEPDKPQTLNIQENKRVEWVFVRPGSD
jgi:hypothetical protein